MQTSNPAFSGDLLSHFDYAGPRSTAMTVQGTALKAFVLLVLVMGSAAWSWQQAGEGTLSQGFLIGSLIGGTILAFVTIFNQKLAAWTSPVYSVLEGIFLGALSRIFEARYPGIALQAVALTGGLTFIMLFVYATGMIRVTGRFAAGITAALGAICLVYIISMVMSLFGGRFPLIHDAGPVGIIFSLFVVGIGSFSLLLDFDFIEKGSRAELPKYMEWYGAFGLMVGLIWLYVQVLQLLAKLQGRSRD